MENVMRKIAILLCSVMLIGGTLSHPFHTYIAHAETMSADVSGGDMITEQPQEDEELNESDEKIEELINTNEESKEIAEAKAALQEILLNRTVMALVYLSDEYPVRIEASYDSEVVVTVPSGQQVQIQDVAVDENNEIWEYVSFYHGGNQYYGYIPRTNLACSDEMFLEWETQYDMGAVVVAPRMMRFSANATPVDIAQFPESYHAGLKALKQAHPNWTFVKMNTNLDWNTVVTNQMYKDRSLIQSSFPLYMQNGTYSSGWAYASEGALKYYLDPRNGLNEDWIFQFEQLTYNASYHTESALQLFLNNTFMKDKIPNTVLTYAHSFWAIGKELGVSPFHLACRVYQEQGRGTSPLISGNYPGYEGYYNYFNIGASGNTDKQVYESGLTKAKQEGWTNGYQSIYGGAKILSANYILRGQDTLYLQKFDVDASDGSLYWHQYMQNICAPTSEGMNIRKSYNNAGSLNNTFVFKIPVYNNMPASACAKPTASYNITLTPPAGYGEQVVYLDGVAYPASMQNGTMVVTAPNGNAKTATMYQYNEAGVPIGMSVWTLSYNGSVYSATHVPELKDLLTYHGFSIRIVGRSGIRLKTGISTDLRYQLTTSGVNGYKLKEYGTLVMNHANRDQYPMIKGGEKVLSGVSYGTVDGTLQDTIYENANGRHRFTSVLVGLPATQYKTEYAFRGYIILTKDGQDITLYGPAMARSIYSLAQQVLTNGQYEQGSSADQFLRQLITDADSVGN